MRQVYEGGRVAQADGGQPLARTCELSIGSWSSKAPSLLKHTIPRSDEKRAEAPNGASPERRSEPARLTSRGRRVRRVVVQSVDAGGGHGAGVTEEPDASQTEAGRPRAPRLLR
jgi:hypothetical protein